MSAKPDYQSALGFELVVHTQPNGGKVHLVREVHDGAALEREATLAERVLWDAMTGLLEALAYALKDMEQVRADCADSRLAISIGMARSAIAKTTGGSA